MQNSDGVRARGGDILLKMGEKEWDEELWEGEQERIIDVICRCFA